MRPASMPLLLLACLFAVAALAGCGGGPAAPMSGQTRTAVLPPSPGSVAAASRRPAGTAPAADAPRMTVTAPKEAAYTIYCRDFTGPDHDAVAERVKRQAEQVSAASPQIAKLSDFYVVRGAQRSVLYHGFYKTYDESVDKREADRARRDRLALESLVDAAGDKVFPRTVFTPLDAPDPTAPPEWDLRNSKAFWTLVVCTYTKPGESKQAAVDSVREARRQGYEAYYLFGENQADVCIGGWPAGAIKRQGSDGNQKKADVSDPWNPETIVVSNTTLSPQWKNYRDEQGRPFKLVEQRVEILDPTLRKVYGDLEYSVNGYTEGGSRPPLLLEVAKATGRPAAIDEAALDGRGTVDKNKADPLLFRY